MVGLRIYCINNKFLSFIHIRYGKGILYYKIKFVKKQWKTQEFSPKLPLGVRMLPCGVLTIVAKISPNLFVNFKFMMPPARQPALAEHLLAGNR